ncbi:MAG: cytochrome-c peroxidase [Kiloniellaceae bacterium]
MPPIAESIGMERSRPNGKLTFCLALAGLCLLGGSVPAHGDSLSGAYLQGPIGEPIVPLPTSLDFDRDRASLGEKLFYDRRLSHDGSLACVSCHNLGEGGDDGLPLPRTAKGRSGEVNTPTIFNSALSFRLGWRGTYRRLADQVDADISDPRLMNSSWDEVLGKLRGDSGYRADFGRNYADGISRQNVLDALSAFHRSLITPNARFDDYLRGRDDALTEAEKSGYRLFKSLGCVSCHQGRNIGGNLFQKVGIFKDYFTSRGNLREIDFGRFLDTGAQRDLFVFRVPSLRNVAVTAPYFHDGSVADLGEAVRKMGEIQLGESLTDEEVGLIVQFLHSLTGEYKGRPIMSE